MENLVRKHKIVDPTHPRFNEQTEIRRDVVAALLDDEGKYSARKEEFIKLVQEGVCDVLGGHPLTVSLSEGTISVDLRMLRTVKSWIEGPRDMARLGQGLRPGFYQTLLEKFPAELDSRGSNTSREESPAKAPMKDRPAPTDLTPQEEEFFSRPLVFTLDVTDLGRFKVDRFCSYETFMEFLTAANGIRELLLEAQEQNKELAAQLQKARQRIAEMEPELKKLKEWHARLGARRDILKPNTTSEIEEMLPAAKELREFPLQRRQASG